MQIRVKSLQGDEYIVSTEMDQMISQLKASISEKASGLPVERLKLIYKGRTMQDSSLVGEYNLHNDCKVHLIIRKQSAPILSKSALPSEASPNNEVYPSTSTTSPEQPPQTNQPNMDNKTQRQNRYDLILRESLGQHFSPQAVEQIMINLEREIEADLSSSKLVKSRENSKTKVEHQ